MQGTCRLCGKSDQKLVDSHVIPKALMVAGLSDGEFLAIAGNNAGDYVRRSRTGAYSQIVCQTCEESFHVDDERLIALVRTLPAMPRVYDRGQAIAVQLNGFNAREVSRSFLSLLFRAALSQHAMFKQVDLGPHLEPLRQFIAAKDLDSPPQFSVFLRVVDDPLASIALSTVPERWSGVRAWRMYVPGITAVIRSDQRPFDPILCSVELGRTDPPIALSGAFSRSERDIIYELHEKHAAPLAKVFAPFAERYRAKR